MGQPEGMVLLGVIPVFPENRLRPKGSRGVSGPGGRGGAKEGLRRAAEGRGAGEGAGSDRRERTDGKGRLVVDSGSATHLVSGLVVFGSCLGGA